MAPANADVCPGLAVGKEQRGTAHVPAGHVREVPALADAGLLSQGRMRRPYGPLQMPWCSVALQVERQLPRPDVSPPAVRAKGVLHCLGSQCNPEQRQYTLVLRTNIRGYY